MICVHCYVFLGFFMQIFHFFFFNKRLSMTSVTVFKEVLLIVLCMLYQLRTQSSYFVVL